MQHSKIEERNKRILSFLVGGVLTALAFVAFGQPGTDSSELQGKFRGSTAQTCSTTNCDLADSIKALHQEVGSSSWTLEALGINQATNRDMLGAQINGIGLGGSTSWTLDSIAAHQSQLRNSLSAQLANLTDNSSWTLHALAIHQTALRDDINGHSSWTLQGLASHMYNVCN
jgi:hypothetical protein